MKSLDEYGYKASLNAGARHSILSKAAKRVGYKTVYNALSGRINRGKAWEKARLQADRNWLKRKSKKMNINLF